MRTLNEKELNFVGGGESDDFIWAIEGHPVGVTDMPTVYVTAAVICANTVPDWGELASSVTSAVSDGVGIAGGIMSIRKSPKMAVASIALATAQVGKDVGNVDKAIHHTCVRIDHPRP